MWLFDCDCDCLEHVKKNISDKLKELHFPNVQPKNIMGDIFITLYNCEANDYNELVTVLKKKWLDIKSKERQGKFVQYFEKQGIIIQKQNLLKVQEIVHISAKVTSRILLSGPSTVLRIDWRKNLVP